MRTNALNQQHMKLKKHRYLQQRVNGFNLKIGESIETIFQNRKTITGLIEAMSTNA